MVGRTFLHEFGSFDSPLDLLLISQSGLACKRIVKAFSEEVVTLWVLPAEVQQLYSGSALGHSSCGRVQPTFVDPDDLIAQSWVDRRHIWTAADPPLCS